MLDLFTAIALILVIEGALYALFPNAMRRAVTQILLIPENQLRTVGLVLAVTGFGIVWLLRST